MPSSIKPEVHNVSLRHQKRTEPRPQVTCTKNWSRAHHVYCSSKDMIADRQAQRQTDTVITILRSPIAGGVMNRSIELLQRLDHDDTVPTVWNSLPQTVLSSDSVAVFKLRLKTFLFSQALFFLCSLTRCLAPAPLKLRP